MTLPVAGIALAAGQGRRLRPLTTLRPKALCPVANRPLLDLALERLTGAVGPGPGVLAVNAHHHADAIVRHCRDRATVSVEQPRALGTAGGVAALRDWLDGRAALVTNADAFLADGSGRPCADLGPLLDGWDGTRCRLLCGPVPGPGDFPDVAPGLRYVGAGLLPWPAIRDLQPRPSGLYEVLWREEAAAGRLELVGLPAVLGAGAVAVDCGTPADYMAANLLVTGGRSVVGEGATVLGTLERSVVWPGAWVSEDERLQDTVRAGTRLEPVTVTVPPANAPNAAVPPGFAPTPLPPGRPLR